MLTPTRVDGPPQPCTETRTVARPRYDVAVPARPVETTREVTTPAGARSARRVAAVVIAPVAKDSEQIRSEFEDVVSMKPNELEKWLGTDESPSVGDAPDSEESTGHCRSGKCTENGFE